MLDVGSVPRTDERTDATADDVGSVPRTDERTDATADE
jgi:hypothetical protein